MMVCSHAPVAAWSDHARLGCAVGTRTRAPPRRGVRCSAVAIDASSSTAAAPRQWLRLECTRGGDMTDTVELQSAVTRLVGTPADLQRYGGVHVSQDVEVRRRCCAMPPGWQPHQPARSSPPRAHSLRRAAGQWSSLSMGKPPPGGFYPLALGAGHRNESSPPDV